jgi:hypothetical protein
VARRAVHARTGLKRARPAGPPDARWALQCAHDAPHSIALSLVSHTNAGKTTLARTLLARDLGEVRDTPHVTEFADAHEPLASPEGDQVEGQRQVPLTSYVAHPLAGPPRRNARLFASARTLDPKAAAQRARNHARKGQEAPAGTVIEVSASGRLVEPSIGHRRACTAAGVQGLTLHGLRRSFAFLTEWVDLHSAHRHRQ